MGGNYDLLENGVLYFSKNLTASDILDYAPKIKINLRNYYGLSICGLCCYAQAKYSYKMGDKGPKFLSIKLKDNPERLAEEMKYQYCMNNLYNNYIKASKTELTSKQVNEFVREFKQSCLRRNK